MNDPLAPDVRATYASLTTRQHAVDPSLQEHLALVHELLRRHTPPSEPGAWLLVVEPPHTADAQWHRLRHGYLIGRRPEADLTLSRAWLSNRHCQVLEDGQDWVLEDLASSNGTFVNGRRISRHFLRRGDVIQLGGMRLVFLPVDSIDPSDPGAPDDGPLDPPPP